MAPRFLTITDVAETLSISEGAARKLVTTGQIIGIQVGGRGQWRIETTELEAYIQRLYAENRARLAAREAGEPFEDDEDVDLDASAIGSAHRSPPLT